MTPDQAEALAARIVVAIDADDANPNAYMRTLRKRRDADRERVASDLAGLRQHGDPMCTTFGCEDGDRYAAGLRRTARLYGCEVDQ